MPKLLILPSVLTTAENKRDSIYPVNAFLQEQELYQDYFIVREIYSSSNKKEKIFDRSNDFSRDAVNNMLKRVQQYLNITLQNLHLKNQIARQQASPIIRFEISVYICVMINGNKEEKLLKTYTENQKNYNTDFATALKNI